MKWWITTEESERNRSGEKGAAELARPEWTKVDVIKFIEIDTANIAEDDRIQTQIVSLTTTIERITQIQKKQHSQENETLQYLIFPTLHHLYLSIITQDNSIN